MLCDGDGTLPSIRIPKVAVLHMCRYITPIRRQGRIRQPTMAALVAGLSCALAAGIAATTAACETVDEISDYVEGHYMGAMEAAHRMLKLKLTHRFPPVMPLHVHDKDGEHVRFCDGDDINDVAGRPPPKSTLVAWFKLNQTDPAARGLHYSQIPEHYRWMSGAGKWQRRKGTTGVSDIQRVVGRMSFASPNQGKFEHAMMPSQSPIDDVCFCFVMFNYANLSSIF